MNMVSSFGTEKDEHPDREQERFYHGLVLGMVATQQEYLITSNRESGLGRYDVQMRPKKAELPAVTMEFKLFDAKKEQSLQDTADRALTQIIQKQYDAGLLAEGMDPSMIYHYGFGFRGKEAAVASS